MEKFRDPVVLGLIAIVALIISIMSSQGLLPRDARTISQLMWAFVFFQFLSARNSK